MSTVSPISYNKPSSNVIPETLRTEGSNLMNNNLYMNNNKFVNSN